MLLVVGSRGQLGRAMVGVATSAGIECTGLDLPELDITDAAAVDSAIDRVGPSVIVNCAAYTAVDAAENDEARAFLVNAAAVAHLAAAADRRQATLVQISTDYVFDGTAVRPYREDDTPSPVSVYGRSKLAGEAAAARASRHLIVRTAWLFGDGWNFVEAIRRQLATGSRHLRVVADQLGCPTYAEDLAGALLGLLAADATGVVNAVGEGTTSWCGFAEEIVRQLGADAVVEPITTLETARPARRPAYSVLDTDRLRRLLGRGLPPWQEALGRYLTARPVAGA